jgi:hypothetical protein
MLWDGSETWIKKDLTDILFFDTKLHTAKTDELRMFSGRD